ncbi:MAM and LDL-receptor class A domain-containing protein 2-like isoform X2 [Littorina saxatilis]|uniref:MAM and LDL-receptor class A domain-containing protein 2-like isoform X2 n=1 Tax=Littorina saxatilis TaxID=31220 RepID=UPI0038B607ED
MRIQMLYIFKANLTPNSMPTSVTVVCLLLFLSEGVHGSQDISCNYKVDMCQWNSDENTTLQWIRNDNSFWELSNYHLELNMDNAKVNNTGRLLSPQLQGSFNQTCQLRFIYSLENQTACQLSVWLRTQTDVPILLTTLVDTNTFDKSPYIDVPCTAESYQIIIEGKKVSNERCGTAFNKLGLYNLEYIIHQMTDGKRYSMGDNGQHSDDSK